MKRVFAASLLIVAVLPLLLRAQVSTPEITAAELTAHIKYLASDALEGRGSGDKGNELAAAYIAGLLKGYGIPPALPSGYYQPFDFVSSVKLGGANALAFEGTGVPGGKKAATADADFRPFGFTSNDTVHGALLFAGYGITAPDGSYDDYKAVDAKGKIVVVLRYSPEGNDPHGMLNQYSSFRNKARTARDKGAVALLVVTGPNDDPDDDLVKLSFDQAFANSGIPAVCVKRSVVAPFFAAKGWTLKALQDSMKSTKAPVVLDFPGVGASLTTEVVKVNATTSNVIGYLPGNDPALKEQVIVLGAHFDHLGYGGPGSGSLKPDTIAIHHGADDNASGTAGLLELAQAFASVKGSLKRGIVFTFFSGEELGTLGSGYYVNNPAVPLTSTVAMLNMDMIGRLSDRTLTVGGTGTSPVWEGLLARYNTDSTFVLKMTPDGYGPSDHAQFYGKDLPVLFFFTGTHNDYHKPSDTWNTINYPGEEQVVRYVYRIAKDLDGIAERPAFAKVQSAAPLGGGGDTRGFRVTLGVVPDYGATVEGMKIGGVRPGAPADKAGMKAGDVIVGMGGKKIMNIYDYMGVLGELKVGDSVEVEIQREGKLIKLTAQMTKRQ
jgi:hypothetical protein